MQERLNRLGERWPWFGTALSVQKRFSEINGNYLASAITLTGFLSLFPLLLFVIGILGFFSTHNDIAGSVISHLSLSGEAAKTVSSAVEAAQRTRKAASVIGIAGLLWSGLGLVAALQYALNTVWQVKGRGFMDKLGGLTWLLGAFVLFAASAAATAVLNFLPGVLAPVGIVVGLVIGVAVWLWTMKVLPNRDVPWRSLLPGAILGAVGFEMLKAVGGIYVPRLIKSSSGMYGSIGVVFAILAWLLFFGRLVVYASVLNVIRWEQHHGTVAVEIQVPNIPKADISETNRAGEAEPGPKTSIPERIT